VEEVKMKMAKDPICGMSVDEKTAKYKSEHMGKTYYFCSQMCKATFDKNPMKYVGEQGGYTGHHSCC
jgi:YHS domain-containing protein